MPTFILVTKTLVCSLLPNSALRVVLQRYICCLAFTILGLGMCLAADPDQARSIASDALSFEKNVRPILKANCFQCHGEGDTLSSGLDVRLQHFLVKGGDSGPAIVPGRPNESRLVEMIRDGKMPPTQKKLAAREISMIEQWISQGAPTLRPEPEKLGPGPLITEEERSHWAFRPISHPAAPDVKAYERLKTPIDAFLLARLEQAELSFSHDADKRTLIRRATFDLLGLPPTPDEVCEFLADSRPDASERLLDRLLSSHHYGENWARHWLDVAGYADSEGYDDVDTVRNDAFPYRDYVIRSLNADKPFDQFILEQLAGDELLEPPYRDLTLEQRDRLVATGFLRMAPDGTATADDAGLARHAVIEETIKIVSTSLLGLTVGCAECHDHRYDPIPQRDYYRIRAILEPALNPQAWRNPCDRQISLMNGEDRRQSDKIEAEAAEVHAELRAKFREFTDWLLEREIEQLPEKIREAGRAAVIAWRESPTKITPEQKEILDTFPSLTVKAEGAQLYEYLWKYKRGEELKKLEAEYQERIRLIRARKPVDDLIRALTEVPGQVPETHVFARGDRNRPGDVVLPGDLSVVSIGATSDFPSKDPTRATTGRRLAWARRLTDGTHPLTARVLVNRFWMNNFGRGLVGTPGDFGRQGEPPTHPELLDWLAHHFMASGWSLKDLQRLMMSSTAYRQSSRRHEAGNRVDADNRLYSRMSVRRLEAEAIRDAILSVSGNLNSHSYGPPVPVAFDNNSQAVVGGSRDKSRRSGQTDATSGNEFRRSIYVEVRRSRPAYVLSVFDAPQMEPNCEARNVSTVAPQSLLLLNSEFIVEQSQIFADRIQHEAGSQPAEQVRHAWRLAYATEATDQQVNELTGYLTNQSQVLAGADPSTDDEQRTKTMRKALASLCQVLLGSNRFLYVD